MNVKLNDLAIMIKSDHHPEHIGLIVEVVKFLGGEDKRWGCVANKPVKMRDEFTGQLGGTFKVSIPDAHLMPVSGLDDDEDTSTDQPINKELELT